MCRTILTQEHTFGGLVTYQNFFAIVRTGLDSYAISTGFSHADLSPSHAELVFGRLLLRMQHSTAHHHPCACCMLAA